MSSRSSRRGALFVGTSMRVGNHTLQRSFVWLGSASVLSRLIDLGAIVLVLRFVSAREVGAAAAAWTVTAVLEPLATGGAGSALITLRRVDRRTLDSAFWVSLGAGVGLALLVIAGSPWLARVFESEAIAPLIAIAGLKLVPVGLASVPQQRLARALRQREVAAASASATLCAAAARVLGASLGAGEWAFVIAQHVYALSLLGVLWTLVPPPRRVRFDRGRIAVLLRTGLPTSASAGVSQLARNLDFVFVSRFLGLEALGLYRVAFDVAMAPAVAIGDVVARSAAPTLRRLGNLHAQLRQTFSYSVRLTLLLALPVAFAIVVLAPYLLALAKDASFLAAVPAARLLALAGVLWTVLGLYTPLAQALERPQLALWTSLEMFVLLATSLWLCLSLFGPFLSIAAAGLGWCVALMAALGLTRQRFRRASLELAARPSSVIMKPSC